MSPQMRFRVFLRCTERKRRPGTQRIARSNESDRLNYDNLVDNPNRRLNLSDVAPIFVFIVVGFALSFVVLLTELSLSLAGARHWRNSERVGRRIARAGRWV
ncbi:hypothetical protein BIW11_03407 [Tropilaelaps mercedesae]|uniref:Uncharacterized protein n=1 Tax=Tropilaelaps mercedesae TaxID=418985 RepID=A0A1V9XM07_9ACAR|nr:hypothetical protein BIW11_03407 [Tropilaelaps mercedesae]